MGLSRLFTGWSLTEIKELSPRDRTNWLEIATEYAYILRKKQADGS